jgi:hypothetical protein
LVKDADEPQVRDLHNSFCRKWGLTCPVHSVEVRARNKGFLWLERRPKRDQDIFYEDLYRLLKVVPVTGLACVIDRPGYNARYLEKYGGSVGRCARAPSQSVLSVQQNTPARSIVASESYLSGATRKKIESLRATTMTSGLADRPSTRTRQRNIDR